MDDDELWKSGFDFSVMACHIDGCDRLVTTYWRSCYADAALCDQHGEIIDMIEMEEIELSCCWYPFAANWVAAA